MLYQRIGVFTALPIRSLDQLSLQSKLKEIGRMGGCDGTGCRADLMPSLSQRAFAEGLGTAFMLAAVVGSGIMAQKLSGGNDALALVGNTLPTGAILVVLILIFGPISGAHFNPEGRAPQDLKVKVRRVTGGARRQRTLASNSAVGRTPFLQLGGSNPLAPASRCGLSAVVSGAVRTADISEG